MMKNLGLLTLFLGVFLFSNANASLYTEKSLSGLPHCNDERLLNLVVAKIKEFQSTRTGKSIKEKRAASLLVQDIRNFVEVPVDSVTVDSDYVTASELVTIKINKGVADSDIRLCRSSSQGPAHNLHLIIYRHSYQTLINVTNYPSSEQIIINYD